MGMKVLKVRLILVPDSELGWPTVSLLHTQEQSTSVQVRSKWLWRVAQSSASPSGPTMSSPKRASIIANLVGTVQRAKEKKQGKS